MPNAIVGEQRREGGHCKACGSNPPAEGLLTCRPCIDAAAARAVRSRANNAERLAQDRRDRQALLKASGTCTQCGDKPVAEGRAKCEECLDRARLRVAKSRAKHLTFSRSNVTVGE